MNYKTQRLFKEYESLSNKANMIFDIIKRVNDHLRHSSAWYSKYLMYIGPHDSDRFVNLRINNNKPFVSFYCPTYDHYSEDEIELDQELFDLDTTEEIEEYWTKYLIDYATKQKKKNEYEQKQRKLKQKKNKKDNEYKTYLKLKKKFEKGI